jgi:N-acyl-D-amino-acid deacylase
MDVAIVNALIVDGSGGAPFLGGVLLRDDRIVGVAAAPLPANFATGAATRVDAREMVLAPGFIDAHGHSDLALMAAPEAVGKLSQGITTEIAGNCGLSAFPVTDANRDHVQDLYANYNIKIEWNSFAKYAKAVETCKPALNLGLLCGHNTLRGAVRGYGSGEASATEVAAMRQLLRSSLTEGALGLSTGLLYVPGMFAAREELVALLTELSEDFHSPHSATPHYTFRTPHSALRTSPCPLLPAPCSFPYATHLRSEGAALVEAIDEAIACCLAAGHKSLHISHLKTAGEANWGKLEAAFRRISQAREQGLAITADRYPYTTSLTQLSAFLPAPWDELDDVALTARLANPTASAELAAALAERPEAYWERLRLVSAGPQFALDRPGAKFADLARERGSTPVALCVAALQAGASVALAAREGMSEDNLRRILAEPWVCGGTDERALPADGSLGGGHPRGYGAMVRHLARLLPECGLGEAVRRLTALPAAIFGLSDRGRIAEGMAADLVLLDPAAVADRADFAAPFRLAEGVGRVWVNGVLSWDDGVPTGIRAGRVVHR